jgi:signal transduction histidine kinase
LLLARLDPRVEIEESLGDLAQRLAASTMRGADGQMAMSGNQVVAKRLGDEGLRFAVIDGATGRIVTQSVRPLAEFVPTMPGVGERRMAFAIYKPDEQRTLRLEGFVVELAGPSGPVLAAVAVERTHFWHLIEWLWEELSEDILPVGVPLVLATLIVAAVTIRHTLRPVARLSEQAGAITPRTTGLRLEARKVPQEVQPLVRAFNATLERLDEGFALQRRFTADAAHQLRTPMAILRARLDGMPARPEIGALKQDCDRVARVVSQLLAISRLEANQIEIAETVDLGQLAATVVADMAPLAIAGNRSLTLESPDAPVLVRGNSAALRDAVLNLIDNALRFGPDRQPVDIVVRPGASVVVADRGPGVAPDDRARVFEPFWRGHDPRGSGSGLGLAIVAEIAAAHGGSASVRERAGGGAEFLLDLPEVPGQAQARPSSLPQAAQ